MNTGTSRDWIKMRCGIADCPQVIHMARRLGKEPDLIVGKLHRVWAYADRNIGAADDGTLRFLDAGWLDDLVAVEGFANAMRAVGWLDWPENGSELTFPNYESHNGPTAKKRAQAAGRAAKYRGKTESNQGCNASVTQVRDGSVTGNQKGVTLKAHQNRIEENRIENAITEKKQKRASPKISLPDGFQVTAEHLKYGESKGIPGPVVRAEMEKFLAYHDAKGDSRYANWNRAFQGWLLRAKEYNPSMPAISPASTPVSEIEDFNTENRADRDKVLETMRKVRESLSGKLRMPEGNDAEG